METFQWFSTWDSTAPKQGIGNGLIIRVTEGVGGACWYFLSGGPGS